MIQSLHTSIIHINIYIYAYVYVSINKQILTSAVPYFRVLWYVRPCRVYTINSIVPPIAILLGPLEQNALVTRLEGDGPGASGNLKDPRSRLALYVTCNLPKLPSCG